MSEFEGFGEQPVDPGDTVPASTPESLREGKTGGIPNSELDAELRERGIEPDETTRQMLATAKLKSTSPEPLELPPATPFTDDETPPEPPRLARASDLLAEEIEPAEMGFEPGNRYNGLQIVSLPPQAPEHAWLFDPATARGGTVRAFYVQSDSGMVGLVPWPGSAIIWPYEQAWVQDLYHEKFSPERKAIFERFIKSQQEGKKEKGRKR